MRRRAFIRALGAGGVAAAGLQRAFGQSDAKHARVVVVGGGFGGATAARYLKLGAPELQVTLIERNRQYVTCPMSNDFIAGEREFSSLIRGYGFLRDKGGVRVVHDSVTTIDPEAKEVVTESAARFPYDRLIVSPGIDFRWDAIEGYGPAAAEFMPHAWKAGVQTQRLRQQLQAMPNGGVYVIAPPVNPFRCPPGPYERVSLIANYLFTYKRRSKILILDAKDSFTKQPLFMQGWEELYPPEMIEWVAATEGGTVTRVDPEKMRVISEGGEYRADVANIIPPQQAGQLAQSAGLTDKSGWCPVDQRTFESRIHADIHVIGDACIAGEMPKSGVSANTQAKVVAEAVLALLSGGEPAMPTTLNACFSLVGPSYGISIAGIYRVQDGELRGVEGAGGTSPMEASLRQRRLEAVFWKSWYENIVADTFGGSATAA